MTILPDPSLAHVIKLVEEVVVEEIRPERWVRSHSLHDGTVRSHLFCVGTVPAFQQPAGELTRAAWGILNTGLFLILDGGLNYAFIVGRLEVVKMICIGKFGVWRDICCR